MSDFSPLSPSLSPFLPPSLSPDLQAIINPEWPDMFVMIQADREAHQQGICAVYRKPQEGGVPLKERLISANVEGDRQHIETVVNFACSFLWANLVDNHFKS